MPRLRHVSPAAPGWHRHRAGRGFRYTDTNGASLPSEEVARIRALAIPPAWTDVWICPYPNGHLQATGVDARGRRQYLYHPDWRTRRDRAKFDRILAAAAGFPEARQQARLDLLPSGMPRTRATALAFRLLDLGYFRIGNDFYANANGSFGLTTLERRHVHRHGDELLFTFVGKSGVQHRITISDADVVSALEVMRRRRDGGQRLLAYRDSGGWHELKSEHVNTYLAELFRGDITAKDFRTWHATVLAAESLALEAPARTTTARRRAIRRAVVTVSDYLGNTPTMAKKAYIDPRVLDAYEAGATIAEATQAEYPSADARQEALEAAVRELLSDSPGS